MKMEVITETQADQEEEEGGGEEGGGIDTAIATDMRFLAQQQQQQQQDDDNMSSKSRQWQSVVEVVEETPKPPPSLPPSTLTSVMNHVSLFIQGLTETVAAATAPASSAPPCVAFQKIQSSTNTIPMTGSDESCHSFRSSSFHDSSSSRNKNNNNNNNKNYDNDNADECNSHDVEELSIVGIYDHVGHKNKTISRLRLQRCILVACAVFLLFLVLLLGGLLGRANKEYSYVMGALSQQQAMSEKVNGNGQGGGTPAASQPNKTASSADKGGTNSSTSINNSTSSTSTGSDSGSSLSPTPPSTTTTQEDAYAGHHCGCPACTQEIWDNDADSHTCGERIMYLHETFPLQYMSQQDACRRIAFEYPCVCGGCDPARCNWIPETPFTVPDHVNDIDWKPNAQVISQLDTAVQDSAPVPNLDTLNLYCFPDAVSVGRTEYIMWGGMKVQVKQDPAANPCGPGNNIFSDHTVIVDPVLDELTLKFANGLASEVRVLLPESQRPYTYGNYAFSVKSILVKDVNANVISTTLPKELVLGIFTWDDTEDYATHQNYNHEVDVEVSRWNCEDNSDVQFLVQPPGAPQQYRFFSGQSDATDAALQLDHSRQHWYNFSWTPGRIDWSSTAGGGVHDFALTTEEALYKGVPDYVQCMPGSTNVEVRLNLWNVLGSRQPVGLVPTDQVEVVFDKFVFEPSSKTHLEDGEFCSKTCQCNVAASSQCVDAICTRVG